MLSPSCRELALPRLCTESSDLPNGPPSRSSPELARAFLNRIKTQQPAAGEEAGLRYLAVTGGPRDHALLLAPSFPSLTALRVDSMRCQHDAAAVLPLLAERPHLQHISAAIGDCTDRTEWERFLARAGGRAEDAASAAS